MSTIKVKKRGYKSPSQINAFIERRDQYIRNYVLGEEWKGNSSFGRGQAVEHGLDMAIDGVEITQAAEAAWDYYLKYCVENKLTDQEASNISHDDIVNSVMVIAQYYINELGATEAIDKQKKVVWEDDRLSEPLMGYADYKFPSTPFSKGKIHDLKTAAKTPSKLSPGYKLQGTVYHHATGCPVVFDYIVNLKSGAKVTSIELTQDDIAEYTRIVIAASNAIDNLWEIIPDEITDDFRSAFNAMAFPNLHGTWNMAERNVYIKELDRWSK